MKNFYSYSYQKKILQSNHFLPEAIFVTEAIKTNINNP